MFSKKTNKPKNKKKLYSPSIFAILLSLLFLVIVISWILYWATGANPSGNFHPAGILEIFTAPIKGFVNSADLIIFLFLMSAFLKAVNESKALEAGIGSIFLKLKGKETSLIIILFFVFVLCGTTFGMCEAAIPFYFLLIPVLIAAGYDSFTAFLVICYGAGIGVLASTINPVLIDNAFNAANSGIASVFPDVQILLSSTGIVWRLVSLIVLSAFVISYILWYTKRIKANPAKSIVYDLRDKHLENFSFNVNSIPPLTKKRKIILVCFCLTFLMLIIGAIPWDTITGLNGFQMLGNVLASYFPYLVGQTYDPITHQVVANIDPIGTWSIFEMAFLFFVGAFVVSIINWHGEKAFGNLVVGGAQEFVAVSLILSIANGFSILLTETGIQTVLISAISITSKVMPAPAFAIVIFILFYIISIFIPSMSGFARSVFPTVGPALTGGAAVVNGTGMTVSGSILGFSFANGLVNLTIPTAAPFVIGLQISDISLSRFYKSAWPLILGISVLSVALLMVGTALPGSSIF